MDIDKEVINIDKFVKYATFVSALLAAIVSSITQFKF